MGCGLSVKNSQVLPTTLMDQGQKYIPKGLISAIKENSQLIVAYADTNSDQKQNLMNCFQFFELNAKSLIRIRQINQSKWSQIVQNLCQSDMMYALYICRILSSYSMILFQFYATNGKRFMEVDSSIKYLKMIKVIEQQLLIERENDPLINNIECQLFQIKAAITIAPTDATEGEEILKQFFGGALKAGLTFTLNDDLIESLQKGVKYIYNEYQKSQFKRKFKLIYYITGLKYSIIEEIEQQKEALDILKRMTDFYQKIIKECDDWEVKCCWIQSISQIINYKISLTQNQIKNKFVNIIRHQQFIVKIKQQYFVSINIEDIEQYQDAQQIFQQLEQLQSLSKIQYDLISGNKELNGYEKLYKMKLSVQKLEKTSVIINISMLNRILQQIENLKIQQNTITNKIQEENKQAIDSLSTLKQMIKEITQNFDQEIFQKNQVQSSDAISDDQNLATVNYLCDVVKINDQILLNNPYFISKLTLILSDNIIQIQEQLKIKSFQEIHFALQIKLKKTLNKCQKSVDQESILSDIFHILEILDKYEGLINYNILQLQYLQISYIMEKIEFYNYEGLQKIIIQIHQIAQVIESDNRFSKIQIQLTSKIQVQLNKIIIENFSNYNLKMGNLLQLVNQVNQPKALYQIQKLLESNLQELNQLITGLNMIISMLQYESVILIQNQNFDTYFQQRILSEVSSHFEKKNMHEQINLSQHELSSISECIQFYGKKIKEFEIGQGNEGNIQNIQDAQQRQQTNENAIQNIENLQKLQKQLSFIITQRELFSYILADMERLLKQQNENIQINKDKYQQNNLDQEKHQEVDCLDTSYFLNTKTLYDKINEPDQFTQYPKQIESQILMILIQVNKSRDSQKQNFFTNIAEQIEDTLNSNQWRIRQTIIYELLQMESNLLLVSTAQINRGLLVKLQIYETDPRIKKLFENPQYLQQQNELMKQYWPTVEEQVQETIKDKLQSLSLLSTEISREKNDQEKQRKQKQYKVLQQEISDQIQNIQSITSSLGITVLFLQDLKLDLARMENTLNQIQQSVNSMGQDIKALIGRTFQELLEIRMKSILSPQSPLSNIQEQNKNTQEEHEHVYIPIQAKEKNYKTEIEDEETNLFSDDLLGTGLVNEFIRKQNKNSLLIHGMAGSGKSTAARKIEQFLWKKFEMNMNQTDFISVVPIFISLPQLKDPIYSAVEDTLKSDNYRFSDKQVQEFKEAVQSGQYRVLFIMDSYDELKQEYLGSNINISNTISKWRCPNDKGRYPKVITTSRTELFATKGYFNWFISESNDQSLFQEVRLVEFNDSQIQQYIKEYYLMEVLKIIRQFRQISDPIEFKQQWSLNRENPQIEKFVQKKHQNKVEELLLQLWKPETFTQKIEDLQLQVLLATPFMMEIVVVLLPMMVNQKSNVNSIKISFITRYPSNNNKEAVDAWQQIVKNVAFMEEYQKSVVKSQKQMESTVQKYFNTQKNYESIKQALVLEPLSSYDFYMEFFENYFNREIQKLKEQGEISDIKDELWEFAHKLANQMTFNNLSQVPFQRSGLVFKKINKDWKDQFFDDDCPEGIYKKQFRKCIPLNQKNGVFSFSHKSLQEFLVAKWLIQSIDSLEKEEFFTEKNWDQEYLKGVIGFITDKMKYYEVIQRKFFNMLLNTKNNKIELNMENMEKDIKKANRQLIQAGSNSMLILYKSNYNFRWKDLSQIYIKDINLAGINLFGTKLVGSNFQNINLSFSNLNNADIRQCQWDSIHINEWPTINSQDQENCNNLFFLNNSNKIACLLSESVELWDYSNAAQITTSYEKIKYIKIIKKSIQDQSNLIALVDSKNIYIFDTILDKMTHQIKYGHLRFKINDLDFAWENRSIIFSNKYGLFKFNLPQFQLTELIEQIKIDEEQIKLTTEQIEKIIEGNQYKINASLKYILVTGSDSILVYDSQNNNLLAQDSFSYVPDMIFSSGISIDGQMIAIASDGIFLYQIDKLHAPQYLDGGLQIDHLVFFNKNKQLVSGQRNLITIWDVLTQIQVNMIDVQQEILSIAINLKSMILAIGQCKGMIKLYDMEENQQLCIKSQGHDRYVQFCANSNNGLLLASGDGQIMKLWDLSLGIQIGKNMSFLCEEFTNLFLEFTNNDEFIFSIGDFCQIDQWNVSNQMKIKSFIIDIDIDLKNRKMIDQFLIDSNQIIRIDDQNIIIWDLNQKSQKKLEHFLYKQNCIFTIDEQQHITAILQTKYQTILGTSEGEIIFLNGDNKKINTLKFHTGQITKIMKYENENDKQYENEDQNNDQSYVTVGIDSKIVISKQGIQLHSFLADNPINDVVIFRNQLICCDTRIIIYNINSNEPPTYLELNEVQNILTLMTYGYELYAGTELGMIYSWDLYEHKQKKELKVSEQKLIKITTNISILIAQSLDGNIYLIQNNKIEAKIQAEYPILFMKGLNYDKLLFGHDNFLSMWMCSSYQQFKIMIFGQFQKLTAMTLSFDEFSLLVGDQNQLIQISTPSTITCASLNKNKNLLLIGDNKGLVVQYKLDGTAQSQWQGQQSELLKIKQYGGLALLQQKEQTTIISWDKKQIILKMQVNQQHHQYNLINENFLVCINDQDFYKRELASGEITDHIRIQYKVRGTNISKDHLILWHNLTIRVIELSSLTAKFIFSLAQKLECDLAVYQESTQIRAASGINLLTLFQQRGALLQQ